MAFKTLKEDTINEDITIKLEYNIKDDKYLLCLKTDKEDIIKKYEIPTINNSTISNEYDLIKSKLIKYKKYHEIDMEKTGDSDLNILSYYLEKYSSNEYLPYIQKALDGIDNYIDMHKDIPLKLYKHQEITLEEIKRIKNEIINFIKMSPYQKIKYREINEDEQTLLNNLLFINTSSKKLDNRANYIKGDMSNNNYANLRFQNEHVKSDYDKDFLKLGEYKHIKLYYMDDFYEDDAKFTNIKYTTNYRKKTFDLYSDKMEIVNSERDMFNFSKKIIIGTPEVKELICKYNKLKENKEENKTQLVNILNKIRNIKESFKSSYLKKNKLYQIEDIIFKKDYREHIYSFNEQLRLNDITTDLKGDLSSMHRYIYKNEDYVENVYMVETKDLSKIIKNEKVLIDIKNNFEIIEISNKKYFNIEDIFIYLFENNIEELKVIIKKIKDISKNPEKYEISTNIYSHRVGTNLI